MLCGKDYINLGVHLRHKHKMSPSDYKEDFGLMKTTALVDKELSDHISKSIKTRLLDPDYKAELTEICRLNSKKNIGRKNEMSFAGKANLSARNAENHKKRLLSLAPVVDKILREKKTLTDVRKEIGMGAPAVKKIIAMGKAVYDLDIALAVGTERRIASRAKNKGR